MAHSSSTWTLRTLFIFVGAVLILVAAQSHMDHSSHAHGHHSAHDDHTSITEISKEETPTVRTVTENALTNEHAHHDMSHEGMTHEVPETTTDQVPQGGHSDHDHHQVGSHDHDHHSSHQPSDHHQHSVDHHSSTHDHSGPAHDHHSMHEMEPEKEMEMMMDQAASINNKLFGKDVKKIQEYVEMKPHGHDGHKDMDMDDHDGHMHKNGSEDKGGMMHGMMMKMYFHFGVEETVLFEQWKVKNVAGMIGSVIGIILLATFYEGLKYFREFLFKQYVSSMQFSTVSVTGESGRVTQVHKVQRHRMLSFAHMTQTGLHVIQMIISYFLMLIFMTYNVWLCLAVLVGAGIGYFVFGWKKATVVDITEHCH